MFNNVVLDVFIGLIFVFLLYSLLATIIQEIIARLLNLRAKLLLNAIRIMLEDRDEESDEGDSPLIKTLSRFFKSFADSIARYYNPLPANKFIRVFYKHPSIKYLGESSWQSKPSYLEPSNFSATIIKLLRGKEYNASEPQMNAIYRTLFDADKNTVAVETGKKLVAATIEPETLQKIQQLYIDAQKDIDRFQALLEIWFNQTMDRASGWYKRQTQWILFIIGLFIAITFNVDTIATYRLLAKDKTARENVVQLAINSQPRYDSLVHATEKKSVTITDTLKNAEGKDSVTRTRDTVYIALSDKDLIDAKEIIQSDIDKAADIVALGWPDCDSCKLYKKLKDSMAAKKDTASEMAATVKIKKFHCDGNPYQRGPFTMFLGWVLTALAISLGAPFWFDLMNKLLKLRGSGPKPGGDTDSNAGSKTNTASTGSSPVQRVG